MARLFKGKEAIAWAEKWLERCRKGYRHSAIKELAYLHLEEKNLKRASAYAFRLWSSKNSDDKHHAETVLGMVALRQNRLSRAKKHLRRSAQVDSTPVLSSFGPTMMLAHGLLKAGEKQAVLDYLLDCQRFWKSAKNRPQIWRHDIETGKTPEEWSGLYKCMDDCYGKCNHGEE